MSTTAPEKVRKQYVIDASQKAIDDVARTCRFVITTGGVDRDNDTVDPMGWEVENYLRNPVILWAHDYSQLPVARATTLVGTGKGLESLAQFPEKGVYPFADTVFELLKGGFLNATSVGFAPKEYTRDEERGGLNFKRQELLEYSVVPVPANPEALSVARSKGIDVEPLREWAEKTLSAFNSKSVVAPVAIVNTNATAAEIAEQVLRILPDSISNNRFDLRTVIRNVAADGGLVGPVGEPGPQGEPGVDGSDVVESKGACPHCGVEYDGPTPLCAGCMPKAAKSSLDSDEDTVRWNQQLSKAFDVEGEPLEPSRTELAWVARFLECRVQDISEESIFIPSARMGSMLSAIDEGCSEWKIDAQRRLTDSGREQPPVFETMRLNSSKSRAFLVDGTQFLSRRADGVKMVQKREPVWSGLYVTSFVQADRTQVRNEFIERAYRRASELNFLKGEAFTLSGEFLERGDLDWPALFLEPKKEAVLRRAVDRINEHGEDMESRGLMMMGPPGTGKTMSGRVMMRQADTTFIWISARDFFRAGAYGAFDYAFEIAAECSPTILFFEDVDNWLGPEHIDLLKTQMDGLKRRKGILTVLTTNFPELIPEALIDRPGRFHDLLEVALPTEEVRSRMLDAWIPEAPDEARAQTAKDTDGFSGAHLKELVHFAKTIESEEKAALGDALARALEKIREQRELVASLHANRSDYRPRRQVRAMVALTKAAVAKRATAVKELPVEEPAAEAVAEPELAIMLAEETAMHAAEEAIVLRVSDDNVSPGLTSGDVREAVRDAVRATLDALVREQTEVALRLARGRVD